MIKPVGMTRIGAFVLSLSVAAGLVVSSAIPANAGARGKNIGKALIGAAVIYGIYKATESGSRNRSKKLRKKRGYAGKNTAKHNSKARTAGRARITSIQTSLAALGFYRKKIDGKTGRGTRSAIRQFQADYGYRQTGRLTNNQFASLRRLTDSDSGSGSAPNSAVPSRVAPSQYGRQTDNNNAIANYQPPADDLTSDGPAYQGTDGGMSPAPSMQQIPATAGGNPQGTRLATDTSNYGDAASYNQAGAAPNRQYVPREQLRSSSSAALTSSPPPLASTQPEQELPTLSAPE